MKTERGFTLIELMITLTVVAILLTVGAPSFNTFVKDNRITTQANLIAIDLHMARSAAVKYQRDAQVCISTNASSCTSGTDWGHGWILWVDKDRDNAVDSPGEILKVRTELNGATTLTSATLNAFTFDSRGFIKNTDSLTLCDDRSGETGRTISILGAGRINTSPVGC